MALLQRRTQIRNTVTPLIDDFEWASARRTPLFEDMSLTGITAQGDHTERLRAFLCSSESRRASLKGVSKKTLASYTKVASGGGKSQKKGAKGVARLDAKAAALKQAGGR